ncbi:transposase [Nocardia sp. NPDC055321]
MVAVATVIGDRFQLTDKQWELLELLLPKSQGHVGRSFANNRLIVEAMLYQLRTGRPWRDLPEHFGLRQTVWKRHRRYAADGTCRPSLDRAARAGRYHRRLGLGRVGRLHDRASASQQAAGTASDSVTAL